MCQVLLSASPLLPSLSLCAAFVVAYGLESKGCVSLEAFGEGERGSSPAEIVTELSRAAGPVAAGSGNGVPRGTKVHGGCHGNVYARGKFVCVWVEGGGLGRGTRGNACQT